MPSSEAKLKLELRAAATACVSWFPTLPCSSILSAATYWKPVFRLPYRFCVPDLLLELELKGHGGSRLRRLGLEIEETDPSGFSEAQKYLGDVPELSFSDCLAFTLAKTRSWTLLTGDGPLRRLAKEESVECHGVLWILDQIHVFGTAAPEDLHVGLTAISEHERCRLPRSEILIRLENYSANSEKPDRSRK